MAPYCTVADVTALQTGLTLGQGNNPTSGDVDTYIALIQADLDVALMRSGYDAPIDFDTVTAPVAQEQLRVLNAKGALAELVKAAPAFPDARRREIKADYDASLKAFAEMLPRLDLASDPLDTEPRGPGVTTVPPPTGRNTPYFHRYQRF